MKSNDMNLCTFSSRMEETIKELYSQLEKLDVKALYERRVSR